MEAEEAGDEGVTKEQTSEVVGAPSEEQPASTEESGKQQTDESGEQ